MKKVMIALSGGVDSSVAALILKEQGYDVFAGTMQVFPDYENDTGPESKLLFDAKNIAEKLNISHYIFNLKDEFKNDIIEYFVNEYSKGYTPNPCIRCNRMIKFGILLEKARELWADFMATGHYAIIEKNDTDRYVLRRALDIEKDQTYMLYALSQKQLANTIFPLATYKKNEVRRLAKDIGFEVHDNPESQDICFIRDNNYKRFLNEHYPGLTRPGKIIDIEGNILGEHRGFHYYTIGQRRGLGISLSYPVYVVDFDREKNALIVDKNKYLKRRGLIAANINWLKYEKLTGSIEAMAQIRYNASAVNAELIPIEADKVKVVFEEKQRAITPGQSVVFYEGDIVIAGGIIESSIP